MIFKIRSHIVNLFVHYNPATLFGFVKNHLLLRNLIFSYHQLLLAFLLRNPFSISDLIQITLRRIVTLNFANQPSVSQTHSIFRMRHALKHLSTISPAEFNQDRVSSRVLDHEVSDSINIALN